MAKRQDLVRMQERIGIALRRPNVMEAVHRDFVHTFKALGLNDKTARDALAVVLTHLGWNDIQTAERRIALYLQSVQVFDQPNDHQQEHPRSLVDVLHEKLSGRAELIYTQIEPFLKDERGHKAIDVGCGDAQVTQLLYSRLGLDICGVDVRQYPSPGTTVPVISFDGVKTYFPDGAFEIGILTNVLHHDENNERVIEELTRIVTRKLVIIETVPIGKTDKEVEDDALRTFLNDYLYNRLFHYADVPVPGTYEQAGHWIRRFEPHGWRCSDSEDLGIDQDTIRDRHHLFVFKR